MARTVFVIFCVCIPFGPSEASDYFPFVLPRPTVNPKDHHVPGPGALSLTIQAWPVPTPFPVGPVNSYPLPGTNPAIVDCGPATVHAREFLAQRLEAFAPRRLVVTHEHVDHAGLAAWLQREHGVEVWLHEHDARVLQAWEREREARQADYAAGIEAADVPQRLRERMRYGGRKYEQLLEPVSADHTYGDGDTIALGDDEYRVVAAPGHTLGSHLLTNRRHTFSGDTLLETITPNALSVRSSERGALPAYLETLQRIRGGTWGTIFPGHGQPFAGVDKIIERALRHAQLRQERILRILGTGAKTAWQVVEGLFPNLGDDQAFLAVSEVLGHLDALTMDGRVDDHVEDSRIRYSVSHKHR